MFVHRLNINKNQQKNVLQVDETATIFVILFVLNEINSIENVAIY